LTLEVPFLPGLPPAWLFLAGALAIVLASDRPRLRAWLTIVVPLVGMLNLAAVAPGSAYVSSVAELELVQLRADRLSLLFGWLFHLGALLGAIFALRVRDVLQQAAALVYAGSALGAVFAGDLLTLFFYWEGMAVSSALLVFARRSVVANGSGLRYLAVHLASGLLLLAGSVVHVQTTGGIAFETIGTAGVGGWLILAAFGIKCGFPLLHNWITDAYPEATPTGTVFLSMFTTKVAVYALARGFAGTELLISIGVIMAVFPIFYAVIENDLRRVLGYSMINQIGFMVVGVGIGTELALNGAVAHAFNEVLFKGLLFMSMGAVLFRVGHVRGSDLGGLYKTMPLTTLLCMVGAASISAFPLFNGFVSKSMIMAALIEHGGHWLWLALLFASAGVFHHAGIKVPFFAFFSHDAGLRPREAPASMLAAMGLAAAGCIVLGTFPGLLYALLPWSVEYVPYTYPHVIVQLQLLLFSALAFAWLKLTGIYPPELRAVHVDSDWVYRRLAPRAATLTLHALAAARRGSGAMLGGFARRTAAAAGDARAAALPAGVGTAALWVGAALVCYAAVYFVVRV
jgi:multicomponent Na+:H+ antiporter subunit D